MRYPEWERTRDLRAAELGAQGGAPPEVTGQGFNRAKSWRTHMVFHSFDIAMDDALVQAKELEKIG